MYLGSTYDAIADAEDEEVVVISPVLGEADRETNEERRAALIASARESYEAWK